MSRIKKEKDTATITFAKTDLPGKIDRLQEDLLDMANQGVKNVQLDFLKVESVDIPLVTLLIAAQNSFSHLGGKIELTNCQDQVVDWIGCTNLIDFLNVGLEK